MCGQVGVIFGTKDRSQEERQYLKWVFAFLLLLSERRGPRATGVAYLKRSGEHGICKRPLPASEYVKDKAFVRLLAKVDNGTTWLAGHTRWPTQGSHLYNRNNQPILVGGRLIGTHNGDLKNVDALFEQLGLPRFAEVDSEIIFRMADDALRDGRVDLDVFKEHLALCRGLMSAVLASKLDPERVVAIKGNKPLELRYHPGYRAMVYASDPAYLDAVLPLATGWQEIRTKPMSIMVFDCDDLQRFSSEPFRLAGGAARAGSERYTEPEREERRRR
jgi:amidophosphoribosyltransferase